MATSENLASMYKTAGEGIKVMVRKVINKTQPMQENQASESR